MLQPYLAWLGSSAVEQENHNLLVGGSNPSRATIFGGIMQFNDLAIRLITGSLGTQEFENIVHQQWQLGIFVVPLSINIASTIKDMAVRGLSLHYNCPEFSNTFIFGESGKPAGNCVQAPADPEAPNRRKFSEFMRPPHYHDKPRIGIVTEGNSYFFAHGNIQGTDVLIKAPVYKNDLIFWPGNISHTFATQEEPFGLLSATSLYSEEDLEGNGVLSEILGVNFDDLPIMPYATYAMLKQTNIHNYTR